MDQTFHAEHPATGDSLPKSAVNPPASASRSAESLRQVSQKLKENPAPEAASGNLRNAKRITPNPSDDNSWQADQKPLTASHAAAASDSGNTEPPREQSMTSPLLAQDPSATETAVQPPPKEDFFAAPKTPQKPGSLFLSHLEKHDLNLVSAYSWNNRSFIEISKERARNPTGFYLMISTVKPAPDESFFCSREELSEEEKNSLDDAADAMCRHGFFEYCMNTPEGLLFRLRKFEPKFVVDYFFLTGEWLEAFAYGAVAELVQTFQGETNFEIYANVIVANDNGAKHEYDVILCVGEFLVCIECKTGWFSLEHASACLDFMHADLGILLGTSLSRRLARFSGVWDSSRIAVCSGENFRGVMGAVVRQAVSRKNLFFSDLTFHNKLQAACSAERNSAGRRHRKDLSAKYPAASGQTFSRLNPKLSQNPSRGGKLLHDYLIKHRLILLDVLTWKYDGFNRLSKEMAANPSGFSLLAANVKSNPDEICFRSKEALSDKDRNSLEAAISVLSTLGFFVYCLNTADSVSYRFRQPETARFILTGKWLRNFAGCAIADMIREIGNRLPCEFYTNLIVRNRKGRIHEYDLVLCVKDALIAIECMPETITTLKGARSRFEFLNVPAGRRVILGTGLNIDEMQKQNIWKHMRITACSPKDFRSTIKELAMNIEEPEPLCHSDQIRPGEMLASLAAKYDLTVGKATRLSAASEKISYVTRKLEDSFSAFSRLEIDSNPDSSSVFCDTTDLNVQEFDRLKKLLVQLRDCGLLKNIRKTDDGVTAVLTSRSEGKAFFQDGWIRLFAYETAISLIPEFESRKDVRIECYGSIEIRDRRGECQTYPVTLLANGTVICVYCANPKNINLRHPDEDSGLLLEAKRNRILLAPGLTAVEASAIEQKHNVTTCEIGKLRDLLADLIRSAAQAKESATTASGTDEARQTNDSAARNATDGTSQTDATPQFVADDADPQASLLDTLGRAIEQRYEAVTDFIASAANICAEGLCLQDIYPESDHDKGQNDAISYTGTMLKKAGILSEFTTDRQRHEYRYTVNPDQQSFGFLSGAWFKHAVLFLFRRQEHIGYDKISTDLMVKTRHGAATVDLVLKIGDNAVYAKTAVSGYEESAMELADARNEIRNAGNAFFVLICHRISDELKKALEAKYAIKINTVHQFETAVRLLTGD